MTHIDVIKALEAVANPLHAASMARFFKSGPGEYGEGDTFLGIDVPTQRKIAKEFRTLPLAEVELLLQGKLHEYRLTALFILVLQFAQADVSTQRAIYDMYLANTKYINNWDLVDCSSEYIVGPVIDDKTLTKLADSPDLWERRIAVLATFTSIKRGDPVRTLWIAEKLLLDKHDLIQKAVGWMLREVGKRCDRKLLREWLITDTHYTRMGRTMLRYAVEHFPEAERQQFLKGQL